MKLIGFALVALSGCLFLQACGGDRVGASHDQQNVSRGSTPLQRHVAIADVIVHGRIRDLKPVQKDDLNSYYGATVEPIEYFKGRPSGSILRVYLVDFGRQSYMFPMMDEQISSVEVDQDAVFFLSNIGAGAFRDQNTGKNTLVWQLILPADWTDAVREETGVAQQIGEGNAVRPSDDERSQ